MNVHMHTNNDILPAVIRMNKPLMTSESNLENYDFSENLYDLLFKLLQPSYCNRISAEKALLLLD